MSNARRHVGCPGIGSFQGSVLMEPQQIHEDVAIAGDGPAHASADLRSAGDVGIGMAGVLQGFEDERLGHLLGKLRADDARTNRTSRRGRQRPKTTDTATSCATNAL